MVGGSLTNPRMLFSDITSNVRLSGAVFLRVGNIEAGMKSGGLPP